MSLVTVTHFADAGCPWDYSAEPTRLALEHRYGEQVAWQTVQVGLHESAEVMAMKGYTTAGLAESYRRFHQRYAMPFCVLERRALMGTWLGARAVKAAERQGARVGDAFVRRLRLGWFVETRRVDDVGGLVEMARGIEALDAERLKRDLLDEVSARALADDMAAARQPDNVALALERTTHPKGERGHRYTTPTYVFARAGQTVTVPGFQPLEAYEIALQNLAPGLERRSPTDPLEFLADCPGELFAAVELAAVAARRRGKVEKQLGGAAGLARLPTGMGSCGRWDRRKRRRSARRCRRFRRNSSRHSSRKFPPISRLIALRSEQTAPTSDAAGRSARGVDERRDAT